MEVFTIFTIPDKRLLSDRYFQSIRTYDDYYEIMSLNTQHCWIVRKVISNKEVRVVLYHKHRIDEPHYHLHRSYCRNVKQAVSSIKSHDEFVLRRSLLVV
jgi:hypothetical protein